MAAAWRFGSALAARRTSSAALARRLGLRGCGRSDGECALAVGGALRPPACRRWNASAGAGGDAGAAAEAATSATAAGDSAAKDGGGDASGGGGSSGWQRGLPIAAAATVVAGGLAYWASMQEGPVGSGQGAEVPRSGAIAPFNLEPMADETFDWADNLFVIFLETAEELEERRAELQTFLAALRGDSSLRHLRYFYKTRQEGDPPMPTAPASESGGSTEDAGSKATEPAKEPLRVVMYKGQRKKVIYLRPEEREAQVKEVASFYVPVSETLRASLRTQLEVPRVSGDTFNEDVIEPSKKSPILLQMYEDTCFLCFLMRPFVNALALHLRERGVPLRIKRLNLERNDFPDGCPVARGTPTFVLFTGGKAMKWEEFKPKEIVDRLREDLPGLGEQSFGYLDELQQLVSRRLQLFTQVVMWTIELQKLDRLYGGGSGSTEGSSDHPADDAAFSAVVTELMLKDMKKHDTLSENLLHLQKEVDELEHDAALMGAMFAQQVMEAEQEEEQRLKKK